MKKTFAALLVFTLLFSTTLLAARHLPKGQTLVTITTSGTPVVLGASTEKYFEMTVCAATSNTGIVYVGGSAVSAANKVGTPLWGGTGRADCRTYLASDDENGNLADHYADSTVSGDKVTVETYYKA